MENISSERFTSKPNIQMTNVMKSLIFIIFVIYLFILVKMILFKNAGIGAFLDIDFSSQRRYNLIPFETILAFGSFDYMGFFRNVVGNVLIFMPIGYLMPLFSQKLRHWWKVVLICLMGSIAVEMIQFIFNVGSLDIDDVILNTAGGLIGYMIFIILYSLIKDRKTFYAVTLVLIVLAPVFGLVLPGLISSFFINETGVIISTPALS